MGKKLFVCVALCALLNERLSAQLSTSGTLNNYMMVESRFNSSSNNISASGSPYLTADKVTGYVIFKNESKIDNTPLRYNAYQNLLEVRFIGVDYIVVASNLKEFGYQDPKTKKSLKYKYLLLDDGTGGMMEILFEDQIIFGALTQIKVRYGAANGLNPGKDELQLNKTHYLIEDGHPVKVSRNNKSLLEALPDFSEELNKYLKSEKLNIKNDSDLAQALTFYKSLKQKSKP